MHFLCSVDQLVEGLKTIECSIAIKSALPILSNVALTVSDNQLTLTATDLEISMQYRLPAEEITSGGITVPFKNLLKFLNSFQSGIIDVSSTEENALILKTTDFKCAVFGTSINDFPIIFNLSKDAPEVQITTRDFIKAINHTLFAVSTDEGRAILTGSYLTWDGAVMTMVASDTHRLAKQQINANGYCQNLVSIVIPARSLQCMLNILSRDAECWISFGEYLVTLSVGNITFNTRKIEGNFPDYRKVIPKNLTRSFVCLRETLRDALRRVCVISDVSNKTILQLTSSTLTIMALSESVGESCEDIPIELDGSPGVIGFNTGYILDALRVIDSKYIKFSFSEPLSPGLLTMPEQEDFLYVVMPMSFDEKDYPNIVINDKSE